MSSPSNRIGFKRDTTTTAHRPGSRQSNESRLLRKARPASLVHRRAARTPVQSVGRPLRHLVAYGSTNKYRPVNRSKASGITAERPSLELYFPCTTATPLTMTATVKAMDSQWWVCRIHLFQFNRTSLRLLSRLRRPVGRFNPELLGVLRVQSRPTELHRLGADDAADGSSAEKAIQNIETNVPPGSTHCDEAVTDVGPQRQACAATKG